MSEEQIVEQTNVLEAVSADTLESMQRAEIDLQIATAHAYPRSISRFLQQATAMATVDCETADSCLYRRPVGKVGSTMQYAEGESIRLAEIVAATYGNLRVQGVISEITPRYVKAIGMAHDLESNYAAKAEVAEPTVTKSGRPYSESMRIVVAKAAQSKAIRDAIFRVVPKSLCKPIIAAAQQVSAGAERPLVQRRKYVVEWITRLPIDNERVYAAMGINGPEELTGPMMDALTGVRTALKEGDTALDEAFPQITPEGKGVNGLKERLQVKKETPAAEETPAEEPAKELRFYCKNCDHEFARRKNGELCPKCLSSDLIDRSENKS